MADPAEQPQPQPQPATHDEVDEKMPSFSSAAEQQAFQQALFSQMASAQALASSRAAQSSDALALAAPAAPVASQLHDDGVTNKHNMLCKFCDTKILLARAATFHNQELSLHPLGGAQGDAARDSLSDHWLVTSQMQFENVGVTRTVDPSFRYLTCAGCDRGPIGINFLNEPSKFYVAHARVKYAP